MFPSLPSPVIFAHRGASSHAPENTLAAFQLAIDQGASAIELDVQLTRDKEVVVFHDLRMERTTDGSGRLNSHTLADIKRLNAGKSFRPAFQNERVPTLREVFESLPEDIFINIDIKNLDSPFNDLPSRTHSVIKEFNAQDRILISSFNPFALIEFSRELSIIPIGFLPRSSFQTNLLTNIPFLLKRIQSIHLPFNSLTTELAHNIRSSGKRVFVYTLNHTHDIFSALEMGIDGFFTDDPGFARRILLQKGLLQSN